MTMEINSATEKETIMARFLKSISIMTGEEFAITILMIVIGLLITIVCLALIPKLFLSAVMFFGGLAWLRWYARKKYPRPHSNRY